MTKMLPPQPTTPELPELIDVRNMNLSFLMRTEKKQKPRDKILSALESRIKF